MSAPRTRRRPGQTMGHELQEEQKAAFLASYRDLGIVRHAAACVGIHRSLVYQWRETDIDFADAFVAATEDANDLIREEIWRRGVKGWKETTKTVEIRPDGSTYTRTVTVHRFSDALLRMAAISRMPEFRPRLDITSNGEQLGAYRAIAEIADDPVKSAAANDLLAIIAGTGNAARDLDLLAP